MEGPGLPDGRQDRLLLPAKERPAAVTQRHAYAVPVVTRNGINYTP